MMTFEDFWQCYPRKTGKLAAMREWQRLNPTEDLGTRIAEALQWQIPQWYDRRFIPHPRTWLHQGRWLDEPDAAVVKKIWVCPHIDQCSWPSMCEVKLANPAKYPVKE